MKKGSPAGASFFADLNVQYTVMYRSISHELTRVQ